MPFSPVQRHRKLGSANAFREMRMNVLLGSFGDTKISIVPHKVG